MKVWYNGNHADIQIGQTISILRLGGFCHNHLFGEGGKLERVTKQHLVFVSESGGIVKTKINNIHNVIGKMGKEGWFISLKNIEEFPHVCHDTVKYWDTKTCTFKKK